MALVDRLPLRLLAGLALALAGLALAWLWFRDSSFAAVERVAVVGSTSSENTQVREALETAASSMSTLHVDADALRESVEPFSSVADVRVDADFPHDLRIEVIEHRAVANVETGGSRVPATGGGLVLRGVETDELPVVAVKAPLADGRVQDRKALAALRVAAAAPPALRARSARVFWGDDGIALDLRNGPDLIFGDAGAAPRQVARGRTRARRGLLRRCHVSRPPRARPGGGGRGRADHSGADSRADRRTIRTLNRRLRMAALSTSSREFLDLQAILPGFPHFDNGQEMPVTCWNPRPKRAPKNARL
jgi:cell division protein FtsQ